MNKLLLVQLGFVKFGELESFGSVNTLEQDKNML